MILIPILHCHIQGLSISLLIFYTFFSKEVETPRWVRIFGKRVHLLGGGQFILHPFSQFEKQDFKNSKIFVCSALIFNIHISRFKTDAGV